MDSAFDYPNPKVQHAQPKHGEWSTRNLPNERQKAFRVSMEQTIHRWQQRRDQNIAMPYHPCMDMYGIFPYIWLIFMVAYVDPMGMTLIHVWWSFWSYNLRLWLKGLLLIPSIDTARNTIWYGNHTHIHTHANKHLVFEYILHYMFLRIH